MAYKDHVLLMNEGAILELLKGEGGLVHPYIGKKTRSCYEEAKRRCPKGATGDLANSLDWSVWSDAGYVTSDSPYVLFVHDGTNSHEIRAKNAQALYWDGADHPVVSVQHPGTKANPFMLEALVAEMELL